MDKLQSIDNGAPEVPAAPVKPETAKVEPPAVDPSKPVADEAAKSEAKAKEAEVAPKSDDKEKSKWAKNEERKGKTWEEINAQKAELAREKEAIAKAKAEVEAARKAPADQAYRDEHGNTAADYRAVEKQLRAKGENAQADAAAELAATVAGKESQARAQQAQQEAAQGWAKNFAALQEKHADLKKQDSDLYKETLKVIQEFPLIAQRPDGINYAVRAAELNLQSKDTENTKAENAKLKAQIEALNKKLSIGGGAPTSPVPEAKSFADMSNKDQGAYLLERAQQADRDRGFADA